MKLEAIIKHYKNVLLFAGTCVIVFIILSKSYGFFNRRIAEQVRETTEITKKIEVAQQAKSLERDLAQLTRNFIDPDSFAFINRVSAYVTKAGLTTVSLKPTRPPSSFGSEREGAIRPIALHLVTVGTFDDLLKFLAIIDGQDAHILIAEMKIGRETENVRAEFMIVGLALKE